MRSLALAWIWEPWIWQLGSPVNSGPSDLWTIICMYTVDIPAYRYIHDACISLHIFVLCGSSGNMVGFSGFNSCALALFS